MLLTIDIGNTNIAFAVMQRHKVKEIFRFDMQTPKAQWPQKLSRLLKRIAKKYPAIEQVIICSVVPAALKKIQTHIRRELNIKPRVVGSNIKVPIVNKYSKPKQVGQDRLVCAFATKALYGAPAIVIDLGTAITFDAISKRGEYLGGVIVPGIRLSAESLFTKTALLPQIDIKPPRQIIGKNTQDSILSGLFYGYGALCQGTIAKMSTQMRAKPQIVMTGGHTQLMKKFVDPDIRIIDEHLVFKGMALLLLSRFSDL